MYNWITLLYGRNQHNIVNQLYFNKIKFFFHSFLWLNKILLYVYTTFCLSIHLLMDTWVISTFYLLIIMLLWTLVYKYVEFQYHLMSVFNKQLTKFLKIYRSALVSLLEPVRASSSTTLESPLFSKLDLTRANLGFNSSIFQMCLMIRIAWDIH